MAPAKGRIVEQTYHPPLMTKAQVLDAIARLGIPDDATIQFFTNLRNHCTKIRSIQPQEKK